MLGAGKRLSVGRAGAANGHVVSSGVRNEMIVFMADTLAYKRAKRAGRKGERIVRILYAAGLAVLLAVTVTGVVSAEDKEKSLAEKREELLKKCQQVIPAVKRMPLKQRKEMASLIGQVDKELKASESVLSGRVRPLAPPDTVVKQNLDDGNLFLDDVTSCIEATKKKKACSISPGSRGWIYEDLEGAFLRDLPTFCRN